MADKDFPLIYYFPLNKIVELMVVIFGPGLVNFHSSSVRLYVYWGGRGVCVTEVQ